MSLRKVALLLLTKNRFLTSAIGHELGLDSAYPSSSACKRSATECGKSAGIAVRCRIRIPRSGMQANANPPGVYPGPLRSAGSESAAAVAAVGETVKVVVSAIAPVVMLNGLVAQKLMVGGYRTPIG